MPRFLTFILVGLGAIAFLLFQSVFVVQQMEQALVTQFGEPVRVIKEPCAEGPLHPERDPDGQTDARA